MKYSKETIQQIRDILCNHFKTQSDIEYVGSQIAIDVSSIDFNARISSIWFKITQSIENEEVKFEQLVAFLQKEVPDEISNIIDKKETATASTDTESVKKEAVDRGIVIKGLEEKEEHLLYKNHLLLIGIDDYKNGVPKLHNAVLDIEKFKDVVIEKYQFEETNCISLTNEDATRKNIIDTFKTLKNKLTPDDNLLFYFSGHGWMDEDTKSGYWLPADSVNQDTSTYLANSEVNSFIRGLKTQHVTGIVDACFSGSLFVRAIDQVVRRYYNIPSRWVLTSGLEEPVSDGHPGENSPFAKSLLTQLTNSSKAAVSFNQLWMNLRDGVIFNSKQTPRCQPVHDAGHLGGEFFFIKKGAKLDEIPRTEKTENEVLPTRGVLQPNVKSLQKQLKKLVGTNSLDEAFEILNSQLSDDSNHSNTVLVRQSNYNNIRKKIDQGIISEDNQTLNLNRIRVAILNVVDDLDGDDLKA